MKNEIIGIALAIISIVILIGSRILRKKAKQFDK